MRRALAGAGCALLLTAPAALAGKVGVRGADPHFAGGAEVNKVTVRELEERDFVVTDGAGRLDLGRDCFRRTPDRGHCYDERDPLGFTAGLGGGNDTFSIKVARGGATRVAGGDGNDRVTVSGQTEATLRGKRGNDHLLARGATRPAQLVGGDGNDRLTGGSRGDGLYGQRGNDVLRGGPGNNRLFGGEGDDQIDGEAGSGRDRIDCGEGEDSATLGANDVLVDDHGCESLSPAPAPPPQPPTILP